MKGVFLYWIALSAVLSSLLFLTGCGTTTVIQPEEVKIPVAISCSPIIPPEPVWMVPLVKHGSHADQIKAMAHDLSAAHGYIGVLQAALEGCK